MRGPKVRIPVSCALLAALVASCGPSTRYVPRPSNHVRLDVQGGRVGYRKNNIFVPWGSEAAPLFICDAVAASYASNAGDKMRSGQVLMTIGNVLIITGFGVLLTIPLVIVGASRVDAGNALAIDAMNRHNDAPTCIAFGPPAAPYHRP
jgi:hypothetical protein